MWSLRYGRHEYMLVSDLHCNNLGSELTERILDQPLLFCKNLSNGLSTLSVANIDTSLTLRTGLTHSYVKSRQEIKSPLTRVVKDIIPTIRDDQSMTTLHSHLTNWSRLQWSTDFLQLAGQNRTVTPLIHWIIFFLVIWSEIGMLDSRAKEFDTASIEI